MLPCADVPILETARLRLRAWQPSDADAFARMNAHPEVMADYGGPISRPESDAKLARYRSVFSELGYGRWLIETPAGEFLGYCGVMPGYPGHPLGEHQEIGWRLVRSAWGNGYATEAAQRALDDAFERIGLSEILSYTAPDNVRSQAVMARLNLLRDPGLDFTARSDRGHWQGLVWVARRR